MCNIAVPIPSACDLDAITFDTHAQIPPPVSISLDDGDIVPPPAGPSGAPQTNAVELYNVLPPVPPGVTVRDEVNLLLGGNPAGGPEPPADPLDDDVDAYETNMTAAMLPHPVGYFFDFSTDQDANCGLDAGDIWFANCSAPPTLFCDDLTQIFLTEDDCDIDALHNITPVQPFPSGYSNPLIGFTGPPAWGYLFSIDANSGPGCLTGLGLDPGDIYYTECGMGAFAGFALWADDVTNLGMAGCDSPGAGTQNSPNYCDLDAISVEEVTPAPTPTITPTATETAAATATSTPTDTPTDTPSPEAAPSCAATPVSGCTNPAKGVINLKNDATDPSKRKFLWKWLKGTAATSQFGDPTTTTSYTLCVYDDNSLIMSPSVSSGGICDSKPCWKALGTGPKGYGYKNKSTNSAGVFKVLLKEGTGNAKILVKAKGSNLGMPAVQPLTQSTAVTAQLIRSGGAQCWETTFPPPAKKNTGDKFKDKIP